MMDRDAVEFSALLVLSKSEAFTLQLLEQSLLKPGQPANDVVLGQLQATAPRDVAELLPHLDTRGRELTDGAMRKLTERREREAQAMRTILQE